MIDASKVLVGTPDQLTTGAVLSAPLGTTCPDLDDVTPAKVTIDPAFVSSGYANSDGLSITPDYSTNDINDWSGALVRRSLESFTGEITWTMIQVDEESFKMAFGESYVESRKASETHGNQLKAAIGAHLPESRAWVFKMKDGDARMLVVVPNGQVTGLDEIQFTATDPVGLAVTLSCYNDEKGNGIYILTDDGKVTTAGSVEVATAGDGE